VKQEENPVTLRLAAADDYPAFVRLCPELRTDDPIATLAAWTTGIAPATWVATIQDQVVGYCYVQEYSDTGYVRHVVVDPAVRRQGVGRTLMTTVADRLRAHGKKFWRLNVKPDNVAAIALYTGMGLQAKYRAKSFRLPWKGFQKIPLFGATVRVVTPERDVALEDFFSLPRGQLTESRRLGRALFEAMTADGLSPVGLSAFNPSFPGAFPFRVVDPRVAGDLLAAMRVMVPDDETVNLVAEDDEPLAALLLQVGADLKMEIVHMTGAL
jgi:ribosomal protein S18 acetylase RimI-like enzyme